MSRTPLATMSVGVVVERRKAVSQWIDYVWRPLAALPGVPDARPWSVMEGDEAATRFYAGDAGVELHPADAAQYRDNLLSGDPNLWVVLRPTDSEPPFEIVIVTANPSEGEAFTEAGNDLVEPVQMPDSVRELVETFVAEHYVEQPFHKRQRNRADPDAMGRRGPIGRDGKPKDAP